MTNLTTRMVVLAAGAIMSVSAAWGQNQLTAEIPFAFETVNSKLPAGAYTFNVQKRSGVSSVVLLRSVETGRAVLMVGRADGVHGAAQQPVLQFLCGPASCSLRNIRTSQGDIVYNGKKPAGTSNHRLETVALASGQGN